MELDNNDVDNNNGDRLSDLPDEILVHILSLIPTKDVISSSILSKRWRNLWTQITSCKLDGSNNGKDFFAIINNIISKLTSFELDSIKLSIAITRNQQRMLDESYTDYLPICVPLICRRKVKDLSIRLDRPYGGDIYLVKLQPCVFETQSLVSIHIIGEGFRYDRLSRNASLPNLKKLHICVDLPNDCEYEFVLELINVCPILEDLSLIDIGTSWSSNSTIKRFFKISSKLLKKFELKQRFLYLYTDFILDVPKLQQIKISDYTIPNFRFVQTPESLIKVSMKFRFRCDANRLHALDILGNISSIKSLSITEYFLLALDNLVTDVRFPVLHNLMTLKFSLVYDKSQFLRRFMWFLHHCPNLETIEISQATSYSSPLKIEDIPPQDCFLTKVKTIIVKNFFAMEDELMLLNYMLSNAGNLKMLRVHVRNQPYVAREKLMYNEFEFCKRLFKFPRSCDDCEIEFFGNYFKVSSKSSKIVKLACDSLCLGW